MKPYSAILLLGPTGSGKTPFGNYLAKKGLTDTTFLHFDFGEELRSIIKVKKTPHPLTQKDYDYISQGLTSGALLENETFYIAENILRHFINRYSITKENIIILNGLPRHVGQAKDVDSIISVKSVIHLACTPAVLKERIVCNTGNDRFGRTDDSHKAIENKIDIFNKRTVPLLDYYEQKYIKINTYKISVNTTPEEIYQYLNQKSFV